MGALEGVLKVDVLDAISVFHSSAREWLSSERVEWSPFD